jgi:glycosyltransferase EpsF
MLKQYGEKTMIHIAVPGLSNFGLGGTSNIVFRISTCFSKDIVYDYYGYSYFPPKTEYVDFINKTGGSFTLLTACRIPIIRQIIKYSKLIYLLKKGRYKICYINANDATVMLKTLSAAYLAGIPVRIGHSHNSNLDISGSDVFRIKRCLYFISHYFCKLFLPLLVTDYFTCSDKATAWMFSKRTQRKKSIIRINNSVDINKYSYSELIRDKKRLEMNLSTNFVIGHIGRFVYQKNHVFLLRVFKEVLKRCPKAILFLIGKGFLTLKIKNKAMELGIVENIIFLDSSSVINEYMQMFDIFILPSKFEGLPLVGIEAQSVGLPCIFSDAVSKETDITGNCNFLSLNEKPDIWAEKVLALKETFIRVDCSSIVKQKGFDIESSAKKLEDIFIQLSKI